MKFLDGSFAEQMNANWPHRFPGSEITHREHLEKNFGLGMVSCNFLLRLRTQLP